jgi:hypothetical protein
MTRICHDRSGALIDRVQNSREIPQTTTPSGWTRVCNSTIDNALTPIVSTAIPGSREANGFKSTFNTQALQELRPSHPTPYRLIHMPKIPCRCSLNSTVCPGRIDPQYRTSLGPGLAAGMDEDDWVLRSPCGRSGGRSRRRHKGGPLLVSIPKIEIATSLAV